MKSQTALRALSTIREYWADEKQNVKFPIDPFAIARSMGIEIEFRTGLPDDVSGLMIQEEAGDRVLAVINADHHFNRQRFTMAHELGHYTAIKLANPNSTIGLVERRDELAGAGTDPVEIDANSFAADLLMPEAAVRLWAWRGKTREALAKDFGVSLSAMGYRLNKLGLSSVI